MTETVDLPRSSLIRMFQDALLRSCAPQGVHHDLLSKLWRCCAGARELTSYAPVPGPMHHKWHHHKKVCMPEPCVRVQMQHKWAYLPQYQSDWTTCASTLCLHPSCY